MAQVECSHHIERCRKNEMSRVQLTVGNECVAIVRGLHAGSNVRGPKRGKRGGAAVAVKRERLE